MTRKIKSLIKDFSISSFNYSGGIGGGEAGEDPPTTTKGDVSGFDTTFARIPIGSNDQVLTADSTEDLGLKWATASGIPSGVITMWHGLLSNIPTGWLLCDGTSGTPNLIAKFVRGVATASTNPSSTGGSDTVTLTTAQLASHTHTQNSHNHTQNSHTHTQNTHNHTQNSHTHTQDAHGHGGSTNTTGSHTHSVSGWSSGTTRAGKIMVGNYTGGSASVNSAGNHSHTVTVTDTTATNQATTATNQGTTAVNQSTTATNQGTTATNNNAGSGSAHDNMPSYYEVAYIMKS